MIKDVVSSHLSEAFQEYTLAEINLSNLSHNVDALGDDNIGPEVAEMIASAVEEISTLITLNLRKSFQLQLLYRQ